MLNLPLPWKRSAPVADETPEPAGRRPARWRGGRSRRVGSAGGDAATAARARRRLESRRQRIAIVVGAVLILAIVAVVLVGVYQQFILPPRVMAGEVRGVRFTMGDLVERIRVLQGINRYQGGQVDFSRIPFQLLTDLLHAEILRQAAPGLGISITDEEIDDSIRGRFRPQPEPGQEADETIEAQLDAEFDNTYKNFLTQVNLTDDAFRRIVAERLQQTALFERMRASLPERALQVELQVVRMGLDSPAAPEAVRERLVLGEDFGAVAREVSGSGGYFEGWVPEGAFPEFDRYLFGEACAADDADADCVETDSGRRKPPLLASGEISPPIYEDESIFILQAIGETQVRALELQPDMQFRMANALVERWKDDQLKQGSEEGWVKINFDSNRYAWVTDQVRLTRPRVTPPPQQ